MSTITDVAREAGVSVATVSRALRGLDRVSPTTRARVLEVAERLRYVASPTATSLASGRTRVIAVVAPFLTRWFFATLVSAIERRLRESNHHVMLFDLEDTTYDSRLPLTREMLWKRADGVITLNIPLECDEERLLDEIQLPVVAIGTPVPGRPLIAIDDAEASRLAAEHLISLGHREIAYIGSVPSNVAHEGTPRARLGAFREVLTAHGIPIREDWIIGSEWTALSAVSDIAPVLASAERPTAVMAASDEMAIGVLEAARRAGLSVPDDLSIIGIDDHYLAEVVGLSTIRQDVESQGRAAAELLLANLLEDQALDEGADIIPVELIVRGTTAPPSR